MLRWMPRRQLIRLTDLTKLRMPIRLSSTGSKANAPQRRTWDTWVQQRLPIVRHESLYSALGRWSIYIITVFTSGHVFTSYCYSAGPTYGVSMLPTMEALGDWAVISNRYRRGRGVKVGDVISFKHPVNIGESAIKRVLAMEGDFVLMNTPGKSEAMLQVPQGHCWVVGDNMLHSRDSRNFGPLPMALIAGKVVATVNWQKSWVPRISLGLERDFKPAYVEDDDLD